MKIIAKLFLHVSILVSGSVLFFASLGEIHSDPFDTELKAKGYQYLTNKTTYPAYKPGKSSSYINSGDSILVPMNTNFYQLENRNNPAASTNYHSTGAYVSGPVLAAANYGSQSSLSGGSSPSSSSAISSMSFGLKTQGNSTSGGGVTGTGLAVRLEQSKISGGVTTNSQSTENNNVLDPNTGKEPELGLLVPVGENMTVALLGLTGIFFILKRKKYKKDTIVQ